MLANFSAMLIGVYSIPSSDSVERPGSPNLGLPRVESNLATVEQKHIRTVGREGLHVRCCGLPLPAREGVLDGRHIVEVQSRDQMKIGRPGRCRNWSLADLELPKPGDLLGEWNVRSEVIFVKGRCILRSLVDHY